MSVSPLPTCWRFSIRRSGLAPLPTSRSLRRTLFASTWSSSDAATTDARGLAEIHRTFGDSHRTSPTKAEFSAASSTDQAGLAVFQASDAPRSAKTDARTSGRSVMIASTPRSRSDASPQGRRWSRRARGSAPVSELDEPASDDRDGSEDGRHLQDVNVAERTYPARPTMASIVAPVAPRCTGHCRHGASPARFAGERTT